jgi:hypothetical protein
MLRRVDAAYDGPAVAASLGRWLESVTFANLDADEVDGQLIDAIVAWGRAQGWRVYRRAPSVVTLPAPMQHRHSVVDVACARPSGPPIVVEVDRADRRRTVEKLVAEAGAGRVPLWVRWGASGFGEPPSAVHLVPFVVTRVPTRRFAHGPERDIPAPHHSGVAFDEAMALPLESGDDLGQPSGTGERAPDTQ